MSVVTDKTEPVTFSPNLYADDPLANYWMRQVSLRLRREICWIWHERGLLPDSSPAAMPPFADKVPSILDMSRFWEEKNSFFRNDPTARYLTGQLDAGPPRLAGNLIRGSFGWVVNELNLDATSSFVLALGLVVAFDNAVGSVVASCLNDPAKTHPGLALAQKIWDEPEQVLRLADPSHPLFSYGLLQFAGPSSDNLPEIHWESPITVPSLIANQLLFPGSSLPIALTPIDFESDESVVLTDNARLVASRLITVMGDPSIEDSGRNQKSGIRLVPIWGSGGSVYMEVVRGIAKARERDVVGLQGDPRLFENSRFVNSLATLCWLRGVDLFIGKELVSGLSAGKNSSINLFPLQSIPITIYLSITDRNQIANIPGEVLLPIVYVPKFSYQQRMDHWEKVLGSRAEGLESVISECSRRFRYEKATISAISEGLKTLPGPISERDFIEACRAELELDIGELAERVVPRFRDEELILPHNQHLQFHEIEKAMRSLTEVHYGWGTARAWNESGISVLFAGPPGTGKTMAAEVLAIKLNLPMYRIDLSQVVNKYIGETEKNLKKLFDAADVSDTIIFFDEADSLFGRRTEVKDAHDRYANLEISYLLERMERFKGLAILATNRKKDLDEAFLRRLRYILDFPLPGIEQRKRIWRQVIPNKVDTSMIDLDFLAKQFPLAGGNIRSIVFNACLQSADGSVIECPADRLYAGQLTMEKMIVAVKREYDKLSRSISLEQFGPYARVVEGMDHE